ncbi:hypothetical protein E1B28_006422 [Marasmius oreades]|uniref:7,8-dihydro-6-hydroxymethylpterin-pyrophosphokinase domain-containing protein n=1 Tax=Marasmius oreades TaxID=181124 RepID=A0A9P7S5P2_9AGAR|nr:uncharacterized protein E1B28_006422 [Marasmius oreades]KAG7095708.1 hypothetical protein E1B28_006422 [Marasmius oreades]
MYCIYGCRILDTDYGRSITISGASRMGSRVTDIDVILKGHIRPHYKFLHCPPPRPATPHLRYQHLSRIYTKTKMAVSKHIKRGHPILFGLLIFFGIIELAISAWLTSRFAQRKDNLNTTERDRVRYILFASIWTVVLSSIYALLFWHSSSGSVLTSALSHLIYLLLTWVIWTAGAAAVTVMLGGGLNCNNPSGFAYCGQLNALEAFAWIEWILTTIALVVVILRAITAARRGDGIRGSLA